MRIGSSVIEQTRAGMIQDPQDVIPLSGNAGIFHVEDLLRIGHYFGPEDLLLEIADRADRNQREPSGLDYLVRCFAGVFKPAQGQIHIGMKSFGYPADEPT